jgi:hypothetical protein
MLWYGTLTVPLPCCCFIAEPMIWQDICHSLRCHLVTICHLCILIYNDQGVGHKKIRAAVMDKQVGVARKVTAEWQHGRQVTQ